MAKQTMGKDDNGVFHPGKGKPSGVNKGEGLGIQATPPEKMDQYLEVTDKYLAGEDELDPSVPMRHPNRNTSKRESVFKGKENTDESDKNKNETFAESDAPVVAEELPGVLTKELFIELANYSAHPCLTLYLGSHAAGVEVNEHYDPINFKTQLQEAGRKLTDLGHDESFSKRLLEPGFELLRDDAFWNKLTPGLAVFIADGFFKFIRMPVAPAKESLVLEPTFYVTPLIPIMTSKEYFHLLVISKQCAKLLRADAWGIEQVAVNLPQSIDEVKRISGSDATTFKTSSSGSGAQEGSYHGAGGGNSDGKDNMLVYFEAVDDLLWDQVLNKENAPLLLAAVEYEIPIYRSACDYHNVWPEALTGNREHQKTTELYRDAMQVMKPYFEQRLNKALEQYMNNTANAKTSSSAAAIIPASYYSQISHLFVAQGEHIWGTFDEMANRLEFHDSLQQGGEDLLDNAVVKTLANGGDVFLLDKERMPLDAQVAAILRF